VVIPVGFLSVALMCSVEAFNRRRPWKLLSAAGACIVFAVVLSP